RERRCLVEKKQLRVAVAENLSPAALEAELTTNPAPRGKSPPLERERARIMKAPSPVPEHRSAFRRRDNLAERRHPVLQRHDASTKHAGEIGEDAHFATLHGGRSVTLRLMNFQVSR